MNLVTNFLLITVLVCSSEYQFVFANTDVRCLRRERRALLKFKEGLVDEHGMISSWGKENECCKWEGVRCSNTTGRVIALQLVGHLWSTDSDHYLGGEIHSALTELHSLKVLDLSGNYFRDNKIPEFICSMTQLQHLNLSWLNIIGNLPSHLWNLTNLETLDLSRNFFLSGTLHPQIGNLANLKTLNLSGNVFSGIIPPQIGNLANLDMLDLSDNGFSGIIPLQIGNLTNLQTLDLSFNGISGTLPFEIGNLTNLYTLYLYRNQFSGTVPTQIGNLINLEALDLTDNNFFGGLPTQLWKLLKLEELRVSFNSLEDIITEADLSKLPNLKTLDLSSNSLTLDISPDWTPPFQLKDIFLSGCKVGPNFPLWIRTQTNFTSLDLSLNGLLGEVPKWISSLSHEISYLNLSHNRLTGNLTDFSSMERNLVNIKLVDLSSNRLEGNIPRSFSSLKGLRSLNLSRNSLTGIIDPDIGQMELLESLDLSSNHLSGPIPVSIEKLNFVSFLDLANNNLSGKIPTGGQLQTFPPFAYAGNIGLCGSPLAPCSVDRPDPSTNNKAPKHVDDDSIMTLSFLTEIGIPIILGFIVGFWGVVGSLIVNESWRRAFYNCWSAVGDWFYVWANIYWAKLRRN